MNIFTDSETRARHRSADLVIASAQTMLGDEAVKAHLDTAEIFDITTRYFVPNLRHGKVSTPKKYRGTEEYLALLSLHDDDKVTIDEDLCRPKIEQLTNLTDYLKKIGFGDGDAMRKAFRFRRQFFDMEREFDMATELPAKAQAIALSPFRSWVTYDLPQGGEVDVGLLSQPVTIYRRNVTDADRTGGIWPGLVGAHEAVHVHQALNKQDMSLPKDAIADTMSRELEAYHFQSWVANWLFMSSKNPSYRKNDFLTEDYIHNVEHVRVFKATQDDPFAYTPEIHQALTERGMGLSAIQLSQS
jgi:hypothetical protein